MNQSMNFKAPAEAGHSNDGVIDLSELVRSLWLYKYLIAFTTVLFLAIGAIYAYTIATPKYRSTSVLLLDTSGKQLVDLGVSLSGLQSDSQAINTEVEVLKSRRLLQRVVVAENLTADPEFNGALRAPGLKTRIKSFLLGNSPIEDTPAKAEERAINALLKAMSARNLPKTDVLQVTVETQSAAKSAALADQIANQYILYQMDVKFEATRDASAWLSQRVADLKLQLEDAEANVAAFTAKTDVVSRESVLALDRQLKELRSREATSRQDMTSAQAQSDLLKSLQNASAEEKSLMAEDARLTRIFQTEGAGDSFDQRFEVILSRAALQAQRAMAQAEALAGSIANLEQLIATQNSDLIELQQLNRDAEATRLLYEYFLGRLKENSAQEGVQQADSRILSNAVVPSVPSEPRKSLILALSAIIGLILGGGIAVLRHTMQSNFRSASDLEVETNLPVLGQIPKMGTKDRRSTITYLREKPTSGAAEAVRNLRTSVLLSNLDTPPQVIMSTSSVPNEGKTTISFSLAQNLSGMGKKVLLVEGDMRRLIFKEYLETPPAKGLTSVLAGEVELEQAIVHDPEVQADILVGEPSKANAADVLSSQKFQSFLDKARANYDHIIIDSPPVLVVPDARVIAPFVDFTLFTVHWDQTRRAQVKDSLRLFSSIAQPIGGLVLNQIDHKAMKRYGYESSYGAYNAYGSKYYTN